MAEAQHSEDDILTCSICLEVFKEPKILPCLHRFCESCLNRHITESVSTTAAKQQGIPCPCCRSFTPAQNHTRPRSEWAAQFKTDFIIKELVSLKSRAPSEVDPRLEVLSYIKCKKYRRLATLDTTTIVAALSEYIDIIDTNGQVLKSFTNKNNSDIPRSGFLSCFVCVSPDKMIIAYYHDNKSLVCLSQDGKTKFKYSQPDVGGVACDSSGNIFLVSGNSLLTLTSDGKSSKTLISSTDGTLSNPTYVCLDNEGLGYVVNNNCSEIKVLSLL